MKERALYSEYIIDGVQQAVTPAQMLQECCGPEQAGWEMPTGRDAPTGQEAPSGREMPAGRETPAGPPVADETVDLAPSAYVFEEGKIDEYLSATFESARRSHPVPVPFAASHTCRKIAEALIDAVWLNGHFRIEDLHLKAEWKWNEKPLGNLAAFYRSVEAASEYIGDLGLRLSSYSYAPARGCSVAFKAGVSGSGEACEVFGEDEEPAEAPARPTLGHKRLPSAALLPEPSDWLIYIPFDTCDFRLGGSLLSEATGARSTIAPDITDADYFIDCYEVVRELVEDGIVKAGMTVSDGGLLTALRKMCAPAAGASISICDIRRAYGGELPVRVLFGEVPGVILQVSDSDYDYIDAEFLLQDVAFFPIGHPAVNKGEISVHIGDKTGVEGILESLLNSQASEGED